MNKFEQVIDFVTYRKVFTRGEFEDTFGEYPNTYSTYLTALRGAGYVANPFPGAFARSKPKTAFRNITIAQLRKEAR